MSASPGLSGAAILSLVLGTSSLLLGATRSGVAARGESRRVAAGSWGGIGIGMVVTGTGARIEYDCAHGTIGEPLLLDADGRFEVKGLHFREHGGPVREGEEERGEPVRYTGRVTGENMTLTVARAEGEEPAGTYELVFGKIGRVRKCL